MASEEEQRDRSKSERKCQFGIHPDPQPKNSDQEPACERGTNGPKNAPREVFSYDESVLSQITSPASQDVRSAKVLAVLHSSTSWRRSLKRMISIYTKKSTVISCWSRGAQTAGRTNMKYEKGRCDSAEKTDSASRPPSGQGRSRSFCAAAQGPRKRQVRPKLFVSGSCRYSQRERRQGDGK